MALMIKRISKLALAVFFISMFTPIVAPQVLEESEAVANKTTICHRTKSVKNPYRMITVSQGAVAGGHSGHEGGLWTTSSVQGDEWGDIIPDAASGGPNNKEKNWTTAGIAIYRGQTLNPANGSPVCKVMSFKQYRDSELAAAGGSFTSAQEAAFLNDIKEAKADEDLTLLNSIGRTFNTLTAADFTAMAAASEAIVVTTKVATLVTTTSAKLNGSVKTDNTALNCQFEYDDNSSLVSPVTEPVAAVAATLNSTLQIEEPIAGLTPGTKYFYRLFCQQSGDAYLYGETFFFTAGTAYSVTYDSNTATSGEVPIDSSLYSASESATVRGNAGVLVKTGSTFAGWALNAEGTGTVYSPNHTTALIMSSNRIFYAKWIAETYTVTFNGNGPTGGAVPSNQTKTYNVSLTLSGNTGSLQKTGHTFAGWNTASGGGGTSYLAGASYTANTGATMWAQWTADTYTVTYNGNGNSGGSVPSDQTKTYDVSLTLQTNSGTLTKGTDTFAGWNTAANGTGTNYAEGASYTLNAGTTLYAKWTAASGGGSGGGGSGGGSSGGGNSANAATPARPTPAAVRKSATLVTLATTPVKSNVVSTPVTPSGATTPGNSGNTPASSGSTGGTTSAPGNSGNTPSSGVTTPATPSSPSTPAPGNSGTTPSTGGTTPATPTTPSPGNSGTTPAGGNTNERINVNNTQLSQTTAISTQAAQSVTFKGVGITQVNVVNNEVAVQARPGFSGKTTVSITVTSAEEVSTITADVIVIPLPVTNPVVRVVSEDRARIQWVRSPNAVTYEVTQNGRLLCTTSRTICTVTEPVSEATPVQIKALGRDQTESTVKQATYVDATIPRVIPEVALVVNFDTAKFNLDNEDRRLIREFAADVARFGFKEVDISGHTDSRGGIDNNVLSNNRAKSARAYLLSLLPNLKVTINGFADAINVAPNTTVEGLAANRRAEFRVVG